MEQGQDRDRVHRRTVVEIGSLAEPDEAARVLAFLQRLSEAAAVGTVLRVGDSAGIGGIGWNGSVPEAVQHVASEERVFEGDTALPARAVEHDVRLAGAQKVDHAAGVEETADSDGVGLLGLRDSLRAVGRSQDYGAVVDGLGRVLCGRVADLEAGDALPAALAA